MPQLITAKQPFEGSVHASHEDGFCAARLNVIHNTPPEYDHCNSCHAHETIVDRCGTDGRGKFGLHILDR
jgi:hypothetical protein